MKKNVVALTLFLLSIPALALDIEESDIEGTWLIAKLGSMDVRDMDDVWTFDGKLWQVISSGVRMKPDPYKVSGDTIDLGHTIIQVLEISPNRMKTKQMGMTYTLERIK